MGPQDASMKAAVKELDCQACGASRAGAEEAAGQTSRREEQGEARDTQRPLQDRAAGETPTSGGGTTRHPHPGLPSGRPADALLSPLDGEHHGRQLPFLRLPGAQALPVTEERPAACRRAAGEGVTPPHPRPRRCQQRERGARVAGFRRRSVGLAAVWIKSARVPPPGHAGEAEGKRPVFQTVAEARGSHQGGAWAPGREGRGGPGPSPSARAGELQRSLEMCTPCWRLSHLEASGDASRGREA